MSVFHYTEELIILKFYIVFHYFNELQFLNIIMLDIETDSSNLQQLQVINKRYIPENVFLFFILHILTELIKVF